jgi:hypothetical protein
MAVPIHCERDSGNALLVSFPGHIRVSLGALQAGDQLTTPSGNRAGRGSG